MMVAVAAMAMSAPLAIAGGERGWFHIPGVEDFRIQAIARTDREQDWPFAVDEGYLLCAWVMGERVVYFATKPEEDDDALSRLIVVSGNPFDIMVAAMMDRDLIASYDSMEQLVGRFAPFQRLGLRLCDQPRGSEIGPGEL